MSVQEGKIRRKWKVVYTEDNDDTDSQKELEEKGYTLPEYAFTVECDGVESEESGQLDVRDWISFSFSEEDKVFLKNNLFYFYSGDGAVLEVINRLQKGRPFYVK